MQKIAQGAEAVLYKKEDTIVKDRVVKSYRHPEIDSRLRKRRTRREAKVISKLSEIGFPVPKLIDSCDKKMSITMSHLDGDKVRDVLHKDHKKLSREIGRKIGILHKNDIIHADLTTSNMILEDEIHFIDFGLSFFSTKIEDKAVDLHLLDRALESYHYKIYKDCIEEALKGYTKTYADAKQVLLRLEEVKRRGRNKGKSSVKFN